MNPDYWELICKFFDLNNDKYIEPKYEVQIENNNKLHAFYFNNNLNFYTQSMSITVTIDKTTLKITEIYVYFNEIDQNGNHIISYENIFKKYTKKSLYAIFDLLENYFKLKI